MNIEELQREYFKTRFAGASAGEIAKMQKDWDVKISKSAGIVRDFCRRVGELEGKKVLDVGFGLGLMIMAFIRAGAQGSGLEVDELLFEMAKIHLAEEKMEADLKLYDGVHFPFADNTFDYLYSTSVLEHVTNPTAVLKESYRVLKPGGKFYLAFTNKLWPKETHTGLYLISYLPRPITQKILKWFGRAPLQDYNLHFVGFWDLKKILRDNDISFTILPEIESSSLLRRTLKKFLAWFGIHQSAILPHVMVVLKK